MNINNTIKILIAGVMLMVSSLGHAFDINKASASEMVENLKGVGSVKAQAIVDYRNKNGAFKSVDDLLNVKGIGPSTLKRNKDALNLSGKVKGKSSMSKGHEDSLNGKSDKMQERSEEMKDRSKSKSKKDIDDMKGKAAKSKDKAKKEKKDKSKSLKDKASKKSKNKKTKSKKGDKLKNKTKSLKDSKMK